MGANTDRSMKKKKPPEKIQKAAKEIRKEDIHGIVVQKNIFPPGLLLPKQGANERVNHLTWVLRYRLAHREVTGLESFRGSGSKRKITYKWAGWKTDTSPNQIENEIRTIYRPDDNPQQSFQEHLEEFVEAFEEHEALC